MDKGNNNKTIFRVFLIILITIFTLFSVRLIKNSNGGDSNNENAQENNKKGELAEEGKLIPVLGDVPPETTPDQKISKEDAGVLALESAVAAQKYYDEFSSQAEMISKGGYFYDFPSGKYLDNSMMTETEVMPLESKDNKSVVLYLNTKTLNEMGGFDFVENPKNPLTICSAYEMKDGFMIKLYDGLGGEISKEKISEIMDKHDTNHGIVVRYHQDSKTFKNIAKILIKELDNKDLDVRYLAGDEKYSFAVVSPVGEPAKIREFVLIKNDDGTWNIGLSGFESDYQYRVLTNKNYYDLNMGILPIYNLHYHLKYVKNDYEDIISFMKDNQLIEKKDGEPNFICGNDEFIYMTFKTGKKYVGKLQNGAWNLNPVESFEAAEVFIIKNSVDGNPPLFLVKQEY